MRAALIPLETSRTCIERDRLTKISVLNLCAFAALREIFSVSVAFVIFRSLLRFLAAYAVFCCRNFSVFWLNSSTFS